VSPECWTDRYSGCRIAGGVLELKPPLRLAWKHVAGGMRQGFVRTGDGGVFSATGISDAYRLDLATGRVVWLDSSVRETNLITRWRDHLLVWDREVRLLNLRSGVLESSRPCEAGLGLQDSYVVGDALVGMRARKFHVVDLVTLDASWEIPKLVAGPLVGDEERVISPGDDVTCFELRTGKVLWHRPGAEFGGDAYRPGCLWEGRFFCILGGQLTALDLETGRTLWRWKLPSALHWWEPYDGRAYCFFDGIYRIVDLSKGEQVFERSLGPHVPEPVRTKKTGLTAGTRGAEPASWRDVRVAVSETHAFLTNASGQIVVLKRDTAEVEQVVEIDTMPVARTPPVIYRNRLLLTGFDAAVYCFEGAAA
jgi:outer membrane protein assembly factor BamB